MFGNPENLAWPILFLPLLSAVVITLFTQRQPKVSALISIGAVALSFVLSCALFATLPLDKGLHEIGVQWLSVGNLEVSLGARLDGLSLMMLLVVTGVGGVIHVYSYGYMHDDQSFSRFFASMSLFTFSMLGIVLASNFLQMFVFWELVGVSSYLLIGFWYERASAADACKKAFITNRLGDFGFLLGIIMVWAAAGSLNFAQLEQRFASSPEVMGAMATVAGLLIFCGAMGKSAQFPLHVWLPDAMEGPTPVSALIHAATMVAAGVYMLCRVFFMLNVPALEIISWIGGFTALLAALIAVQQDDIKRILAYSTLSQLGYMVMAVGLGGPTAAMYHLTTHAFFKALLFLGAGSIIHALHHEQDIWKMGGLKDKMPVTFWTFILGTLALAGVPPLSGFFSKDEILAAAFHHNVFLFAIAVLIAVLTTFYMFRLVFVALLGKARSDAVAHAHESPGVMKFPLLILAVPTVLAGFWSIDGLFNRQFSLGTGVHATNIISQIFAPFNHSPAAALAGIGAVIFGFSLAMSLYQNAESDPLPRKLVFLARAMRNRFYFDELYVGLVKITQEFLASVAGFLDRWIVAGLLVRGTHGTTDIAGRALRLVQTGNLQTYAFLFAVGVALVLLMVLGK